MLRRVVLIVTLALVVAGALTAPALAKPKPKPKIHVSLALSATRIAPGGSVVASGRVIGAAAGKRVILQANYGSGGWKVAARGVVHNDGTYSIVDRPVTKRARTYRAFVPGGRHHRSGYSNRIRMVIKKHKTSQPSSAPAAMQWYSLYDLSSVDYQGIYGAGSLRINGGYFTKALYDDDPDSYPSYREYNLARVCTRLTATAGLADDDSDTGSLGEIDLLRDSVQAYHKQFALGQSESIDLDLTNTLRIRIETTSLVSGKTATGALGSPKVYCNSSIELGTDD